jgi:type VI secretion system protein ImpK
VVLVRPEAPPLPPIPVVESGQLPRIKGFLQDEIRQGLVEVFEDPQTITVRVLSGMFASGSATVNGRYLPILGQIGQALEGEAGQVVAVGHTDAIPIRTVAFPSNWHLSMRRAEAVQTLLGPTLSDPTRLSADGRASNQPIDTNDTAAGRSRNRRIEIMLMKDGAVWQ